MLPNAWTSPWSLLAMAADGQSRTASATMRLTTRRPAACFRTLSCDHT
jgi:hypothetical protein